MLRYSALRTENFGSPSFLIHGRAVVRYSLRLMIYTAEP